MGLLRLLDYHFKGEEKCVFKQIGDGCNHRKEKPVSLLSPCSKDFKKTKKGRESRFSILLSPYGFFIIISASIARTMTTSTTSAAVAGRKYRSAADGACVGTGVGVAAAGSTTNAVTACDGQ